MKTLKEIDEVLSAALDAVEELDHRNEVLGFTQMKFYRYGQDLLTAIRARSAQFLNPIDAPKPAPLPSPKAPAPRKHHRPPQTPAQLVRCTLREAGYNFQQSYTDKRAGGRVRFKCWRYHTDPTPEEQERILQKVEAAVRAKTRSVNCFFEWEQFEVPLPHLAFTAHLPAIF